MNEEYLYPDGNDQETTSEQSSMPGGGNEERPSDYTAEPGSSNAEMPEGSNNKEEQIPQVPKPEVSWSEPQSELYREGTVQTRGEYHQAPPQGEYQQGSYQQNPYQAEPSFGQSSAPYSSNGVSQGFGIASLVLGIISLVLFCTCFNILLAAIAIIFGILQLVQTGSKKGPAIAGIITSVLSILLFFISVIVMMTSTDFKSGFEHGFENRLEDFYNNYDIPNYGNEHHNDHDDTF